MLSQRLKCPRCGSRRVRLFFNWELPGHRKRERRRKPVDPGRSRLGIVDACDRARTATSTRCLIENSGSCTGVRRWPLLLGPNARGKPVREGRWRHEGRP